MCFLGGSKPKVQIPPKQPDLVAPPPPEKPPEPVTLPKKDKLKLRNSGTRGLRIDRNSVNAGNTPGGLNIPM